MNAFCAKKMNGDLNCAFISYTYLTLQWSKINRRIFEKNGSGERKIAKIVGKSKKMANPLNRNLAESQSRNELLFNLTV